MSAEAPRAGSRAGSRKVSPSPIARATTARSVEPTRRLSSTLPTVALLSALLAGCGELQSTIVPDPAAHVPRPAKRAPTEAEPAPRAPQATPTVLPASAPELELVPVSPAPPPRVKPVTPPPIPPAKHPPMVKGDIAAVQTLGPVSAHRTV